MVVPRKAPSSSNGTEGRTAKSKKGKSFNGGTLDRRFDASVYRDMESDESFGEVGRSVTDKSSHRHRYKRRQKNAERSRSREAKRSSSSQRPDETFHNTRVKTGRHQTLIQVTSSPNLGVEPAPRFSRMRQPDEHVYEVPVESTPVMV